MNLHAINSGSVEEPRAGTLKFAYPGGARPLEGYTIKRGIGRGGFGEVYYATSDAGKEVALKLIRRNLDVELRGVGQCLNIKHPNLLALYDIKRDELGDSWVVMEYVAGECLEDVLQQHPLGLPPAQAMRWFCGVCAGVAALHDRGIVHRDLKPGNIFSDEGLVKVGDYGLSKFISASRRSGQTESVGTVHYMAPEVGHGRYGKEIDIYALGIILYEMLTGHVPFDGESVGEVLIKHLTAEPDLSSLAEPFRTAIARALAKDPARRWQSVAEMLQALGVEPQTVLSGFGLPGAGRADLGELVGVPRGGGQGAWQETASQTPGGTGQAAMRGQGAPLADQCGIPAGDPLTAALRRAVQNFSEWWRRAPFVQRFCAVLGVGVLVLATMPALPMVVGAVAVLYAVYWVIWMMVTPPRSTPSRKHVPHTTAPYGVGTGKRDQPLVAELVPNPPGGLETRGQTDNQQPHATTSSPERLPQRSRREKLADLLGSLLVSAAAAALISLLWILLVVPQPSAQQYVWFTLTSTIGSWCVLGSGHWWGIRRGEPVLRRLWMLCLGLAVGAASWTLGQWLLVNIPIVWAPLALAEELIMQGTVLFDNTANQPTLFAHMLYFGVALALVRWWKQVHPHRRSHLSLWFAAATAAVGWLVSLFVPYPQPMGMLLAANTSLAAQIAAPRLSPPPAKAREPEESG